MPKTQTFTFLDRRPPPKTEFHQEDQKLDRKELNPNRVIPPGQPCMTCPDGIVFGNLITDEDAEIIYATINGDFSITPNGMQVFQNVAGQAIRVSGSLYRTPTNARYLRSVSVDFLFMDTGWRFEVPRDIRFVTPLDEDSFVWVRYVA